MKYICIRQQDEMDCDAACLASVAGYYGLKMPVARLRRLAGTDRGIVKYNFQDFVSIWTGALIFIEPGSHGTSSNSGTPDPATPSTHHSAAGSEIFSHPQKNRSCSFSCSRS